MRKNEVSKIYFLTYLGVLDIARTEPHSFGRHLVGILPRGLPQLPKRLRHQNNKQKQQKNKNQDSTKNPYVLLVFTKTKPFKALITCLFFAQLCVWTLSVWTCLSGAYGRRKKKRDPLKRILKE